MTLGTAIRKARLAAGLTLHGLGARLDVSTPWVCDVELGRRVPSLDRVGQLATALGLEAKSLLDLWLLEDTAASRAYRAGFEAGRLTPPAPPPGDEG